MKNTYIVAAKRSPIGAYLGSLSKLSLVDLGAQLLTKTLAHYKIEPNIIDNLIMANVLAAGNGQGPARQIALKSGLNQATPAYSLNMICGSGLKAVVNAYAAIQSDLNEVVAVVGAESMSNAAYVLPGLKIRQGSKMGNLEVIDTMINDALTDAFSHHHMGVTAENIVAKLKLSRLEQDQYAFNSQTKAITAQTNNAFQNEIIEIKVNEKISLAVDESPRASITLESLAKLRPVFQKENGTVTAGNSSSLNDGAATVLVVSEDALQKYNLKPLVKIVAVGEYALDPQIMGLGPTGAVKNALLRAKMNLKDIDILELNEAFAAQSLGVIKLLAKEHNLSEDEILAKTNLNGGAISLGHPVGASGTRILVTLIHLLITKQKRYGLASLCIGGGMGVAIIVKNVQLK